MATDQTPENPASGAQNITLEPCSLLSTGLHARGRWCEAHGTEVRRTVRWQTSGVD